MKRLFVILFSLLTICVTNAQFRKDNFEVGLSGSFGGLNATNVNIYAQDYSTYNFTFLSAFVGYYLFDGWSIEPEFGIFAVENNTPAQYAIANISYTKMRKDSPFAFFGKIGFGVSNSLILTYNNEKSTIQNPDNFDTRIISLGMGIKYLVDNNIALRGEFNYKFQNRSLIAGPVNGTMFSYDSKYETFSIAFGAALLF